MLGTPNASCVQGKWVNLASCAPCGGTNALPTVENGIVESHEGGQLTLKCQEGFTASGATSARCSDEDPERRSVGTCKKNCSDPTKLEIPFLRGYDEGSEFVLAKDGSIPHGVSINNLSCKSGFALVGNSHFTCNDGKWWNEKEKPRCAKSCSNFPLGIVHGAYQYSDKNPRLHGDGTQISALQCDPGYIAEGFAPLTCSQGEWKGDNLGTCVIDSSLGVTLTGPVVSDASFYIYLFLNRERVAGYLIDESLYATFKEKNYSVSIEPGKIYDLGVECGDFRESQGGKSGAQHRKFTSSKKITFTAGEHLSVSCGGISSDRQAELPIQEVVLSNGEAKL
jgi:hypothetical protein